MNTTIGRWTARLGFAFALLLMSSSGAAAQQHGTGGAHDHSAMHEVMMQLHMRMMADPVIHTRIMEDSTMHALMGKMMQDMSPEHHQKMKDMMKDMPAEHRKRMQEMHGSPSHGDGHKPAAEHRHPGN